MDNHELVMNDMRSLVQACDDMKEEFLVFARKKKAAARLAREIGSRLADLSDEWARIYEYVAVNGFEDDGAYSYAKLGYEVSLAYKKRSEIINEFRFGLERLKLLDEYSRFEANHKEGNN